MLLQLQLSKIAAFAFINVDAVAVINVAKVEFINVDAVVLMLLQLQMMRQFYVSMLL